MLDNRLVSVLELIADQELYFANSSDTVMARLKALAQAALLNWPEFTEILESFETRKWSDTRWSIVINHLEEAWAERKLGD